MIQILQKFGGILGSEDNPTNMKFNKKGLDEFVNALTNAIKGKQDASNNNQTNSTVQ